MNTAVSPVRLTSIRDSRAFIFHIRTELINGTVKQEDYRSALECIKSTEKQHHFNSEDIYNSTKLSYRKFGTVTQSVDLFGGDKQTLKRGDQVQIVDTNEIDSVMITNASKSFIGWVPCYSIALHVARFGSNREAKIILNRKIKNINHNCKIWSGQVFNGEKWVYSVVKVVCANAREEGVKNQNSIFADIGRHANIIEQYATYTDEEFYYLCYEIGGSIKVSGNPLPEKITVSIVRDIADALAYLHKHGIVHLDVKPESIVLVGNKAKLISFFEAKRVSVLKRCE